MKRKEKKCKKVDNILNVLYHRNVCIKNCVVFILLESYLSKIGCENEYVFLKIFLKMIYKLKLIELLIILDNNLETL